MTRASFYAQLLVVVSAASGLAGCGVTIPDIKEVWDTDRPGDPAADVPPISATAQIEFGIKEKVYCELKHAVQAVNKIPVTTEGPGGKPITGQLIPLDWLAQVSLSLQVDEGSTLGPGVTYNHVLENAIKAFGPGNTVTTGQSFNLGFGATLSSTATRTDTFNPSYPIGYLMIEDTKRSVCVKGNELFEQLGFTPAKSSPFLLESDLGIEKWLLGAMIFDRYLPSVGAPSSGGKKPGGAGGDAPTAGGGGAPAAGGGKKPAGGGGGGSKQPDTVTYEIKFVIVSNGNATPTWKLMRVSANTSGTLFSAGRTRTHDLIITIGPQSGPQAQAAAQSHLAAQIGNAVSNATRSALTPP